MSKKKRKHTSKPQVRQHNHSNTKVDQNDFRPDPLVEGDSIALDTKRIFTVRQETIQYSFREHYLYFPWENRKSRFYSQLCPPGSYHLEKRADLKNFDFFSFIKDAKKVRMYRFALENRICDDLLEYISDELESKTISLFRQKIEELRDSRQLITTSKPEFTTDSPPLRPTAPNKSDCHFLTIRKVPTEEELKITNIEDPRLNEFLDWFNNLNDPLVTEVTLAEPFQRITIHSSLQDVSGENFSLDILQTKDSMLRFGLIEDIGCIRKTIKRLISKYFNKYGTKFKFVLASSPGSGKTYMKHLFSGYNITDLDDISMFDPIEGKKLNSLIEKRKWNDQKIEYHRIIRTKFKEGVLLAQNSDQVPKDLPYLNIITPGHIGERKLWSDRGLYDLVIKNRYKIFVDNQKFRNVLFQIVYEEIFNSDNYS